MGLEARWLSKTALNATRRMNREAEFKFRLEHNRAVACKASDITDLEKWRKELLARHLIGRKRGRYGGLGYGNLSKRMRNGTVLITGSQTAHLKRLTPAKYARVIQFAPRRNRLRSKGLTRPSSEALSHLAIYRRATKAEAVFHTHCPEIWNARKRLNIPTTNPRFEGGTRDLFFEVQRLLKKREVRDGGILAMGGHRDGIMTWGKTADQAGSVLVLCLAASVS